MIILKDIKQINQLVNELFALGENGLADNDYSFVNEILPEEKLASCNAKQIEGNNDKLDQLSLFVFQLNNFIPALCNIINLMLITKSYDSIYFFTTRIFYEHIGTINYTSTEKAYNYNQRMFDRFVEIIKNCQISKEKYIPFILEFFKDDTRKLAIWQEPALEFLKKFESENPEWVNNFIFNDEQGFEMLCLLCYFSTQKGIKTALEYFQAGKNDTQVFELFKQLKKEFLLFVDKEMSGLDDELLGKVVEILLSWGEDNEAKSRLEEIYKSTQNPLLRNAISHKIGGVQLSTFKSEKNFLFAVRRNIQNPQERTLGLPFDRCNLTYLSGLKADFASYTYLINLLKEEKNLLNIERFLSLKNVFTVDSLQIFANQLLFVLNKKDDINAAKWAVRFVAMYADEQNLENMLLKLISEKRTKEAKYLLSCMIYSKKDILPTIKNLSRYEEFATIKEEILKTYAQFNDVNIQIVREQLLPEEFGENTLKQERKILFENFIAGREYSQDYFDQLFLNNKLYNTLAQDIVFGEFRFGRLYSAFIIEGRVKTFVYGGHIDDSVISIIHTTDCDERTYALSNIYPNSTFNQFEPSYFNVNNFSRNQVSVQSFAGTVVTPENFCHALQKYEFYKNRVFGTNVYSSVINKMPMLDLVCELEFENQVDENTTYKTLSSVYFYRLCDCIETNGKLVTPKQSAISIGSLPARYFSHVLSAITNAIKDKN